MIYKAFNRCQFAKIKKCLVHLKSNLYSTKAQNVRNVDLETVKYETTLPDAQPYSSIPGPTTFQFLRSLLPGGRYYNLTVVEVIQKHREDYGDLFKFPGVFGGCDILVSHDPHHFQIIYRNDGPWPDRIPLKTMMYYREKIRPDIFGKHPGLANAQGKAWGDFRMAVNPVLAQPKTTKLYIPQIDSVAADLVHRIRQIRDPTSNQVPENFEEEMLKWSLESISLVAMDTRLGLISDNCSIRETKLIKAVRTAFQLFFELEFKPSLWRIYPTPNFKRQMKALDAITNLSGEIIDEARSRIENSSTISGRDKQQSVLHKLLKVDPLVAKVMAIDMIFGGVDTTSTACAALLYYLAKNPDKQDILRNEITNILPSKNTPLSIEKMSHVPYLRACLKESLRLHPVVNGNVRNAGQDLVLNGYRIPKGTTIIMAGNLLQQQDEHYPNARNFEPERWLKTNGCPAPTKSTHPFIFLPFGFGPRMCIGRRFAEVEIEILVTRIVRNFCVEWEHEDLKFATQTVNVPADKLMFTFKDFLE